MGRAVCVYCTLRAGQADREWLTVERGTAALRFCSIYCLADWAAEQERAFAGIAPR